MNKESWFMLFDEIDSYYFQDFDNLVDYIITMYDDIDVDYLRSDEGYYMYLDYITQNEIFY